MNSDNKVETTAQQETVAVEEKVVVMSGDPKAMAKIAAAADFKARDKVNEDEASWDALNEMFTASVKTASSLLRGVAKIEPILAAKGIPSVNEKYREIAKRIDNTTHNLIIDVKKINKLHKDKTGPMDDISGIVTFNDIGRKYIEWDNRVQELLIPKMLEVVGLVEIIEESEKEDDNV